MNNRRRQTGSEIRHSEPDAYEPRPRREFGPIGAVPHTRDAADDRLLAYLDSILSTPGRTYERWPGARGRNSARRRAVRERRWLFRFSSHSLRFVPGDCPGNHHHFAFRAVRIHRYSRALLGFRFCAQRHVAAKTRPVLPGLPGLPPTTVYPYLMHVPGDHAHSERHPSILALDAGMRPGRLFCRSGRQLHAHLACAQCALVHAWLPLVDIQYMYAAVRAFSSLVGMVRCAYHTGPLHSLFPGVTHFS